MGHDNMAIEPARKISISIPGYNPDKELQKTEVKLSRIRAKKKKRAVAAAGKKERERQEMQAKHDAETEALNRDLAKLRSSQNAAKKANVKEVECRNPFL